MLKLISIGILSGLFFSTTFVLNRLMSLEGGHWVWTASLRYMFMLIFLLMWFLATRKIRLLKDLCFLFFKHWIFWILTGTIGFGFFYALISYSASFSQAWIIAATWQITIIATPIVLIGFKKKVPRTAMFFSVLIFSGIILVNVSQMTSAPVKEILMGGLPVIIAAFCYPVGNQLVWEVQNSKHTFLPKIDNQELNQPFAKVLLMTMGSVPFWVLLIIIFQPPAPPASQISQTAVVALFSGIIATSLFLYARQISTNSYELSAVDATQSSEVIFALVGEVLFLHADLPNLLGGTGIVITILGLYLYIRTRKQ